MEIPTTSGNEVRTTGVKRRKPGILYLSTVPPRMNIPALRIYFGKFGQIGRVYFQAPNGKGKFSEGWIEYKSKRKAKYVQELLNNEAVGGKKRNPNHDFLWNIKYLPRFKWEHLNQRLEYERQIFRKRMGAEISQVNKETDAYLKAQMNKRKQKEGSKEGNEENFQKYFKQKLTEEEFQNRKKLSKKQKDEKFKKSIEKKKKKKQEFKQDKNEEEDFLASSIFVGRD
ncbi:UNVERIFIED_CONTAM: hypothetical protein RMT77_001669 [Armadillidium vulgare]